MELTYSLTLIIKSVNNVNIFMLIFTLSQAGTFAAFNVPSNNLSINDIFNNVFRTEFRVDSVQNISNNSLCIWDLETLRNTSRGMAFIDACGKIPPGLITGNLNSLGHFHSCLGIQEVVNMNRTIEGKYCLITLELPLQSALDGNTVRSLNLKQSITTLLGQENFQNVRSADAAASTVDFTLALCIPTSCDVSFIMDEMENALDNTFSYAEKYCRARGDRPLNAVDWVTIGVLALIGLVVTLSTGYDIRASPVDGEGGPTKYKLLCAFSLYSNSKKLMKFERSKRSLGCLDGIRAISMFWVIVGHTFAMGHYRYLENPLDVVKWVQSYSSLWILSAPVSVDTFFLMSGLLVTWTVQRKFAKANFPRHIPLFYLRRWLQMVPSLGLMVLFSVSWLYKFSDGPSWPVAGSARDNCSRYWWSVLLFVQNYVNPNNMCIAPTWYLSVDMQLYVISPIVLIPLFGRRRVAWAALAVAIGLAMATSLAYSFTYHFPATIMPITRLFRLQGMMKLYYFNTLTRASPYYVGMALGYALHITRDRKVKISHLLSITLWIVSIAVMAAVFFGLHPFTGLENQPEPVEDAYSALHRPAWAFALSWLVFACVHGYGGPINWFLSLELWCIPAKLSYAMFLIHFPLMTMFLVSESGSFTFSVLTLIYKFGSDALVTMLLAVIMMLFIDYPVHNIQNIYFDTAALR